MSVLRKIKDKIALTREEKGVVIFIILSIIVGDGIIYFKKMRTPSLPEFSPKEERVSFPIDINEADYTALLKVPGIGETIAKRIITLREEIGEFENIEELLRVKGIGKKKLDRLKGYIVVEKKEEK